MKQFLTFYIDNVCLLECVLLKVSNKVSEISHIAKNVVSSSLLAMVAQEKGVILMWRLKVRFFALAPRQKVRRWVSMLNSTQSGERSFVTLSYLRNTLLSAGYSEKVIWFEFFCLFLPSRNYDGKKTVINLKLNYIETDILKKIV